MVPSESDEPAPLNETDNGATPLVGSTVAIAVGSRGIANIILTGRALGSLAISALARRDRVKTTALVITALKARSKCSFSTRKLRFFAAFRLVLTSLATF